MQSSFQGELSIMLQNRGLKANAAAVSRYGCTDLGNLREKLVENLVWIQPFFSFRTKNCHVRRPLRELIVIQKFSHKRWSKSSLLIGFLLVGGEARPQIDPLFKIRLVRT